MACVVREANVHRFWEVRKGRKGTIGRNTHPSSIQKGDETPTGNIGWRDFPLLYPPPPSQLRLSDSWCLRKREREQLAKPRLNLSRQKTLEGSADCFRKAALAANVSGILCISFKRQRPRGRPNPEICCSQSDYSA